ADRKLRVHRRAELADNEHVERGIECPRDLERDRNAAPRQAEHDDAGPSILTLERGAEKPPCLAPVAKDSRTLTAASIHCELRVSSAPDDAAARADARAFRPRSRPPRAAARCRARSA